jgi:hypothetical protein
MTDPTFNTYAEMAEEGEAYERSLVTWMEDHGHSSRKPWPDHVVEAKERRLAWVRKIIELLRRASKKQEEAA